MANYRTALTRAAIEKILDYDPDTGIFRWRRRADRSKQWNTRYAGTVAGQKTSHGYVAIQVDGKGAYQASRLAWLLCHGSWPEYQVDHINGIRNDDRIANLRAVDNSQNNQNRVTQRNSKSGIRGVTLHETGRYRVRLMIRGTNIDLGYFDSLEEAVAARRELEEQHHGEFAPKNSVGHGTYPPRR